ncbi:DNA polymerase IV [Streptomyces sp. NP160]|uniref:DNA polymerase IV n=1 Tax=Streptomyces sp. NP160 TaxID=2586637 RepID=UPI00214B90B2|nr:DNA polymerase IV [Streptomyces sp. NP160]
MSRSQLDRASLDPAVAASVAGLREHTRGDASDGCTVLHVDMDAFYASVSLLERPDLRGKPVIVGGGSSRGVVLSATYEARRSGVHSAMSMSRARRLCPDAVVLPPDPDRYAAVSAAVVALFTSVTPVVEQLGMDEAFLDVSGAVRRYGSPLEIATDLRDRVADEQGVTCSVGLATTKAVAKLASGRAKPDGALVVPADQVVPFLHPLPTSALWGVGEKTEQALARLGLHTVGQVAHTPSATLRRALGDALGTSLHELAWGRDPRPVVASAAVAERSTGAQETFAVDVDDPEVVLREVLRMSERVARHLRRDGHVGRTVVLVVRFADFTTVTRSRTLREATDSGRDVYAAAAALWTAMGLQRARIRLVGVRVEGLVDAERVPRQLRLDEPERGWREADRAVDAASRRFGSGVVTPASLLLPRPGGQGRAPAGGAS